MRKILIKDNNGFYLYVKGSDELANFLSTSNNKNLSLVNGSHPVNGYAIVDGQWMCRYIGQFNPATCKEVELSEYLKYVDEYNNSIRKDSNMVNIKDKDGLILHVRGCQELKDYFLKTNNKYFSDYDDEFGYRIFNGEWVRRLLKNIPDNLYKEVSLSEYLGYINKPQEGLLKEVLNVQIGGSHYKDTAIQPIEYIMANKLSFPEGCIVKYISRHRRKNGKEDLLKIIQNTQMILADEYGVIVEFNVKQ